MCRITLLLFYNHQRLSDAMEESDRWREEVGEDSAANDAPPSSSL